jgi:hypothetical protein
MPKTPETGNRNNLNAKNKTPPKFDGVCQQSEGAVARPFP